MSKKDIVKANLIEQIESLERKAAFLHKRVREGEYLDLVEAGIRDLHDSAHAASYTLGALSVLRDLEAEGTDT